jgi:hypothetical protein
MVNSLLVTRTLLKNQHDCQAEALEAFNVSKIAFENLRPTSEFIIEMGF